MKSLSALFRRRPKVDGLAQALALLDEPSVATPGRHAVFDRFQGFAGEVAAGFTADWSGALTRDVFNAASPFPGGHLAPAAPAPNEDYFEWIDVLQAVEAARGRFVMLELGAGYGRWSLRGYFAARQRGLSDIHLVIAEAEPQHAAWLRQNLEDNAVPPASVEVVEAAISGSHGEAPLSVHMPGEGEGWYGQMITPMGDGHTPVVGEYFGHPLIELPGGARVVKVPMSPLSRLIEPHARIDLVDFDLQGAEADAVEEALPLLTERAARLHIGTHSKAIEARLPELLAPAGWVRVRDFPGAQVNETPYGPLWFDDGLQTWFNSRLI